MRTARVSPKAASRSHVWARLAVCAIISAVPQVAKSLTLDDTQSAEDRTDEVFRTDGDDGIETQLSRCAAQGEPLRLAVVFRDGAAKDVDRTPVLRDWIVRAGVPPAGAEPYVWCSRLVDYCAAELSCSKDHRQEILTGLATLWRSHQEIAYIETAASLRVRIQDAIGAVRAIPSSAYPQENVWTHRGFDDPAMFPPLEDRSRIAIFDSGVNDPAGSLWLGHEALPHAEKSIDCTDANVTSVKCHASNAPLEDLTGHGTAVAVTALGRKPRGKLLPQGSCPFCGLVDVRVIGRDGTTDSIVVARALEEIIALNEGGLRVGVVVMAFAGDKASLGRGVLARMINRALEMNVIVVSAIGNAPVKRVPLPASAAEGLSVAGIDNQESAKREDDRWWRFSSRGPRKDCQNPTQCKEAAQKPDVAAPAVSVCVPIQGTDDRCRLHDGTSIAAAAVGGVVGLLRSLRPLDPPKRILDAIEQTACGHQNCVPVWKPDVGWGTVDAWLALQTLK